MASFQIAEIGRITDIANRAIDVQHAEDQLRADRAHLHGAYQRWKEENAIGHVARDSLEWDEMMRATTPEYDAAEAAKRNLRNARCRLRNAIMRFEGEGRAA